MRLETASSGPKLVAKRSCSGHEARSRGSLAALVTTITCLPRALSPVDALDHAGNGGLADVEHAEGIEQEHVELVGDGIEIGGMTNSMPDDSGRGQAVAHGFIVAERHSRALVGLMTSDPVLK
jgi:hypothetical protein